MGELAPLIAVIGCDGSGKSTLSADLLNWIREQYGPAETHYLGLRSGQIGNRIKAWPLVGPILERALSKRAGQARTKGAKMPGLATALVIYGFSRLRKRRFQKVLRLRRQGFIVVTDRYPQVEVPGFYDGPGLSAAEPGGRLIAALAASERAAYEWMASFVPTLVIRLNIDAATAFSRKPDHAFELLERKVAVTPLLRFNGAPVVDLDATMPYAEELSLAKKAVAEVLG